MPCDREPAIEPFAVGEQLRARSLVHDGAAIEHDRALGDRQDQAWVLLDDDRREAFVADQPRIYEQLNYGESIFVF